MKLCAILLNNYIYMLINVNDGDLLTNFKFVPNYLVLML